MDEPESHRRGRSVSVVPPYSPLSLDNLAASVAEAMLKRGAVSMSALEPFAGGGLYALYYVGKFPAYRKIRRMNEGGLFGMPIYVGKATPSGGRKGKAAPLSAMAGALFGRLREHAGSVSAASNLALEDFFCRFLVVEDIWIPMSEGLLIAKFSPLWNVLIDGFGNHDPGSGRHAGLVPRWDVLHPGRKWAERLRPREETGEDISREVVVFLDNLGAGPAMPLLLDDGENP